MANVSSVTAAKLASRLASNCSSDRSREMSATLSEERSAPERRKILHILAWAYWRYGEVLPSNESILSQSKT